MENQSHIKLSKSINSSSPTQTIYNKVNKTETPTNCIKSKQIQSSNTLKTTTHTVQKQKNDYINDTQQNTLIARLASFQNENKSQSTNNEYLKRRVQDLTNQKKALIIFINENCPAISTEKLSNILNEATNMSNTPASISDDELAKIIGKQIPQKQQASYSFSEEEGQSVTKRQTGNQVDESHKNFSILGSDLLGNTNTGELLGGNLNNSANFFSPKLNNFDLSAYEIMNNKKQQNTKIPMNSPLKVDNKSGQPTKPQSLKNTGSAFSEIKMNCQILAANSPDLQQSSMNLPISDELKIAEKFFVAGVEKNTFMTHLSKFKSSVLPEKLVLEPKIIFTYPECDVPNNELKTSCKQAFPNDVHVQRVKVSDCMSEINELIFCDATSIQNKIFAFPVLNYKNIGMKPAVIDTNSVKGQANPNDYTYYVCLSMDEFFNLDSHVNKIDSINANKKEFSKKFYTTKLMLCIVTKYPFISFFKDFLTFIANSIKIQRASIFSSNPVLNDQNVYTQIDSQFLIDFLGNEVRPTLTKLLQVRCPGFNETILINNMHHPITFTIPSRENCFAQEAISGHDILFSCLPYQEFILVFLFLMLEKSIVFVDEDLKKLTSCITTLTALLKPFLWTYPQIPSLPKSQYELLNAPVPIIAGVNMSKDNFIMKLRGRISSISTMIIVYLHEGKLEFDSKLLNQFLPPYFSGLFKEIEIIYRTTFEKTRDSSTAGVKMNKNTKKTGDKAQKKPEISCEQRQKWGLEVVKMFKKALTENIVALLPEKPIYRNENKKVCFFLCKNFIGRR